MPTPIHQIHNAAGKTWWGRLGQRSLLCALLSADGGCGGVQEHNRGHQQGEGGPRQSQLVSLCQLPFVLSPEAKARIMQGEALLQKQHQVQASAIQVTLTTTLIMLHLHSLEQHC